jgi:hypothetical protein
LSGGFAVTKDDREDLRRVNMKKQKKKITSSEV